MATHDYVIDNQSAPAFRADLNGALQAVITQNSSATAPTTTYANMIWYDTANNQIKKRNEADSAWITLGTVDEDLGTFTPSGERALATQAEAEAGTSNTVLMTPLRNNQADVFFRNANMLGWGQTWQDVVSSRTLGTSYQNTTGRPIAVATAYTDGGSGSSFQVSSNNSTWITLQRSTNNAGINSFFIVPNSWYYRTTGTETLAIWAELR